MSIDADKLEAFIKGRGIQKRPCEKPKSPPPRPARCPSCGLCAMGLWKAYGETGLKCENCGYFVRF